MKKIIYISVLISICVFSSAFAQFKPQQQSLRSLFSDVKAFQKDDAIMVYIMEDTQADNTASTSSKRSTDLSAGVSFDAGSSGFDGSAGIKSGNGFSGTGTTSRKERIRAKLSARVISVETNGNLSIEGKRTTKVNGETQTVVIRGIVRPVDVLADNSVYSYNILDLTLLIEGDGSVTETQEPGLITKFLRILF